MLVLQSEEVETSLAQPSTEVCNHLGVECFYDSIGQRAETSAREAPEWLVTSELRGVSVQPWTKDNNLLRKFKFSGTLPAPHSDPQHLTWNLECLWGCVSKFQLRLDKFVNLTSNYTNLSFGFNNSRHVWPRYPFNPRCAKKNCNWPIIMDLAVLSLSFARRLRSMLLLIDHHWSILYLRIATSVNKKGVESESCGRVHDTRTE